MCIFNKHIIQLQFVLETGSHMAPVISMSIIFKHHYTTFKVLSLNPKIKKKIIYTALQRAKTKETGKLRKRG